MSFKVGDWVVWESAAMGHTKKKAGVVVYLTLSTAEAGRFLGACPDSFPSGLSPKLRAVPSARPEPDHIGAQAAILLPDSAGTLSILSAPTRSLWDRNPHSQT